MWRHQSRETAFCLCVDDIGLKYKSNEDLEHFLQTLKQHYKYHIDKTGTNYLGLTMHWNYKQGFVDVSMPKYIPNLLKRLKYKPSKKQEFSPHEYHPFEFKKKGEQHLTKLADMSAPLNKTDKKIFNPL